MRLPLDYKKVHLKFHKINLQNFLKKLIIPISFPKVLEKVNPNKKKMNLKILFKK